MIHISARGDHSIMYENYILFLCQSCRKFFRLKLSCVCCLLLAVSPSVVFVNFLSFRINCTNVHMTCALISSTQQQQQQQILHLHKEPIECGRSFFSAARKQNIIFSWVHPLISVLLHYLFDAFVLLSFAGRIRTIKDLSCDAFVPIRFGKKKNFFFIYLF